MSSQTTGSHHSAKWVSNEVAMAWWHKLSLWVGIIIWLQLQRADNSQVSLFPCRTHTWRSLCHGDQSYSSSRDIRTTWCNFPDPHSWLKALSSESFSVQQKQRKQPNDHHHSWFSMSVSDMFRFVHNELFTRDDLRQQLPDRQAHSGNHSTKFSCWPFPGTFTIIVILQLRRTLFAKEDPRGSFKGKTGILTTTSPALHRPAFEANLDENPDVSHLLWFKFWAVTNMTVLARRSRLSCTTTLAIFRGKSFRNLSILMWIRNDTQTSCAFLLSSQWPL
jgi:hypothetical protein